MKVIEPRTLLLDEIREVDAGIEIRKSFNQVLKLLKEKHPDYSELDLFYCGYVLSNPSVRDSFKLHREKEVKRDNRISMELWRGSKK